MAKRSHKHSDRYDVSGNVEAEFVDREQTVLVNKKGITDLRSLQIAEEEGLANAYEALLEEVRLDTPINCDLIRHTHLRIFGDLYDWAGRWRTVWIRKPGITWPPPDFLDQNMQELEQTVLQKYPAFELQDDAIFCAAIAEIQGEFLVIHPFREGNARTIKVCTNLLAIQTGRPLLVYNSSNDGQEKYIAAATAAFKRNYAPMAEIIQQALDSARSGP
jgi:cell filamentation protein